MKKILIIAAYLSSTLVMAEPLSLIKERSSIKFISVLRTFLIKSEVPGTFSDFNISVDKKANILDSSLDVQVKTNSIDTKDQKRDKHVRGPDFFDVEKFPLMTFKATKISALSEKDKYEIKGILTLKGKANEILFNVEAKKQDNIWHVNGETTISRTKLGLTYQSSFPLPKLMDEIKIKLDVYFSEKTIPKNAQNL